MLIYIKRAAWGLSYITVNIYKGILKFSMQRTFIYSTDMKRLSTIQHIIMFSVNKICLFL